MAFTVQQLVDEARGIYPDMPESVAVGFANAVHTDMLAELQLTRDIVDIDFVANQQLYDLPASVLKVWQVVDLDFIPGSSSVYKQVSERELDRYFPKYRVATGLNCFSEKMCFVNAKSDGSFAIGLYPAPTVTTAVSGTETGYPKLRVFCTIKQTLALSAGGGAVLSLPESVRNLQAYAMYIQWKWSLRHDKPNAAGWRDGFLAEKAKLKQSITNLLTDVQPRSDPFFKRRSRPV